MSREVYTYVDLTKIKQSPYMKELKKYPIITVSTDLKKAIKGVDEFERVDGLFSADTLDLVSEFAKLSATIHKQWYSDQTKFHQLIILSEYMRKKSLEAASDEKRQNWLTGCTRNLSLMLGTIRLLELAEADPEDFQDPGNRNLELLVDAWKHLRKQSSIIDEIREDMQKLTTKEAWDPILKTVFDTTQSFLQVESIVFHAFYYFTPLQARVIRLLENAGFHLIFLIPYDERYPFVYEVWDRTYNVEAGFPEKSKWHMERSSQEDVFGELFEGKERIELSNELEIKEYTSVMEFVDDIKKIKKSGYSVYSSNDISANQILKDYYPNDYGERRILSYPIGQFVSTLNQMWDEEKQTICLDEDHLIDCFSSGWLSVQGISGKQYIQDLIYILPFFTGCHTIDQWEERIQTLKMINEEILQPFFVNLDAEESVARWQTAISNPLANFSMFAVEPEKLDVILALIKQLLEMARELFGENSVIRVSEHINKLDRILKRYELSHELYAEERELVGDLFEKLAGPQDNSAMCSPADAARALNFYISGSLDDGEIETNKLGLVHPVFYADTACIKSKSKVHICMCDVQSMPGGGKEYFWPLTSAIVHKCYETTNNPYLKNIITMREDTPLANRYFMYCALKNKKVTLSWISNLGEKRLAPSPYIKLICEATGKKLRPTKTAAITYSRVAEASYGAGRIEEYDKQKMPAGVIKEARMAYALCPMKYTLGYILEKYPTFQSDFQQNYALNALISAIYELMKDTGITKNQVYQNVMDLFPGLRKVEKRQVYDYISYETKDNDVDYDMLTECGGYYFTDQRLKLHYPNQRLREVVFGRYGKLMTPDGRKGMNLYEVMEATSDEEVYGRKDVAKSACIFCPHVSYCRNALYAGDQENYYD